MTAAPANPADVASVAERALVGACLLGPDVAQRVVAEIGPHDLHDPRLATVLRSVVTCLASGAGTDPLSVGAELERVRRLEQVGGQVALLDLLDEAAALAGDVRVPEHAAIVVAAADRRRMAAAIREAHVAAERGADPDELRALLRSVTEAPAPAGEGLFRDWTEVADDPPIRWLADGLLPEQGIVVVAGAPNSGKSLLAMDAAMRAAHGQDWFGRRVRPTSTLYCAGEGAAGYGSRLRAWRAAHPAARLVDGHTVAIVNGVPDLSGGAGPLRAAVEAFRSKYGRLPGLVVVDTWAAGAAGVDENDASAVGAVLRGLAELAGLGLCVVVIHHARKLVEGQRQGGQSDVRGSTAITGAADVVLLAAEHDDTRTLRCAKSRDGERPAPIHYRVVGQPTGRSRDDGAPEYGPVVLPAVAEAPAADPVADAAAESEAMIAQAVQVVAEMGGAPSRTSITLRMTGRRDARFAAVDLAIQRGAIGERPAGERPRYVIPDQTAPRSPSPRTPPGPGSGPLGLAAGERSRSPAGSGERWGAVGSDSGTEVTV